MEPVPFVHSDRPTGDDVTLPLGEHEQFDTAHDFPGFFLRTILELGLGAASTDHGSAGVDTPEHVRASADNRTSNHGTGTDLDAAQHLVRREYGRLRNNHGGVDRHIHVDRVVRPESRSRWLKTKRLPG